MYTYNLNAGVQIFTSNVLREQVHANKWYCASALGRSA